MEFDGSRLLRVIQEIEAGSKTGLMPIMTLHCLQCNTVLGDSHGICGEFKYKDSILCLKVTNDVLVSEKRTWRRQGELTDCIFSVVSCRSCGVTLGKVIHSALLHLAELRSLFLLHKANISCYILKSSSMVNATSLQFDMEPCAESIQELLQQVEAQMEKMLHIEGQLAKWRTMGYTNF